MQKPTVIFVLGGPGSGKGTQCELATKNYGFVHLSAGDLLRAERKREGSKNGELIQKIINEGKIVPSQITVSLLEQAMQESGWEGGKFLIDGFPRNLENMTSWNEQMEAKVETPFIVFFQCKEETMMQRLLKRGQSSGRSDDNQQVIKKRFNTFYEETMPVVKHFDQSDRVLRVQAEDTIENVCKQISASFESRGFAKIVV